MKPFMKLMLLPLIVAVLFTIGNTGCNKTNDVLAPEELAPISNLKALSHSGEVALWWTASSSAGADWFSGYRIITKSGTAVVDSQQVGKNTTNATVSNLTNGASYTFSVRSLRDNGAISQEVLLQWGPTQRFTAARIYEYNSSSPSGLQFSTASTFAFKSSSPDNRGVIDIWIDGRSGVDCLLKSPDDQSLSTGWRTTLFKDASANDMDTQVDVPAIGQFRSTPGLQIIANEIYFAKTADENYVRFQVSAVQGTAPNRYVDVTIAYNSGTGPWAKK